MNSTKRIRVGLLGAGYIVDLHVEALERIEQADIVAVCDLSIARAEQVAAQLPSAKAYADLGAMLEAENLDVVHNLSPPEAHFATSTQILQAGVDVYCEKPFCTTSDDSRALTELAADKGRVLAVSHNFLWADNYRKLKSDVSAGKLGRIDHVNIVWQKELPQIEAGATDAWMFKSPVNILGEIGPHPLGHLLDLTDDPQHLDVLASNPTTLASGSPFFRRWQIRGSADNSAFDVLMSFAPGYTQHYIHVRGSLASATVDFERNSYVRHRHRPGQFDLERLKSTTADSCRTMLDGFKTMSQIVLTKAGLSKFGSPFSASVGEAVEAFYAARDKGENAHGLDGEFATRVITLIEKTAAASGVDRIEATVDDTTPAPAMAGPADTLVIGGTGFIGRNLVDSLIANGKNVRVVGRSNARLKMFDKSPVQTAVGDLADEAFMQSCLDGIKTVYSLAKGSGDSWEDWKKTEVEPMRSLARACLEKKVERLIYTSSIAIFYTGGTTPVTNQTKADPGILESNVYAKTKAACEDMLLQMHASDNLPVVITRPGIVVGSGGPPKHGGLAQWPAASVCVIPGSGEHPLPFVLASDVADALVRCAEVESIDGQCFNLVGDVQLTANEYVDELERLTAVKFDRYNTPAWRLYSGEFGKWIVKMAVRHHNRRFPRYREQTSLSFSAKFENSQTKEVLGWVPETDRASFVERGIAIPAQQTMLN